MRPPAVVALVAGTLAVRVLGIALVLPGFAAYGAALGGDPALVGLAFGAYGLTMALLQVPFGALSDRWGRRPVLAVGLAIAALGNLLAVVAPTVPLLLGARLVQGAGAVNGVALALLADRVPEEARTTALAWAGASIGVAFTGGVVLGAALPLTMPQLFLANAALNAAAFVAVLALVPPGAPTARAPTVREVARATTHPRVLALDAAGLAVNAALSVVLFAFPTRAEAVFGSPGGRYALAAVVLVGGVVMFGAARRADRTHPWRVAAVALAALPVAVALVLVGGVAGLVAGGVLFFGAQSTLHATVPSLAAREPEGRGAVQGSVQTAQYAGTALGGVLAGVLVAAPLVLAGAVAVLAVGALAAGRASGALRA